MLSTSTHDTKRGEDGRLRVAALAEIPQQWSSQVREWRRLLAAPAEALGDRNLEYFFYQTLIASHPAAGDPPADYRDRVQGAMLKAAREARARTSWARPDIDFEARLSAFVDAALSSPEFRRSFAPFLELTGAAGARNSLLQTVIKLTVPGVPDTYQGAELWDLSLVDPDNRRRVDFEARSQLLASVLEEWRGDPAGALRRAARHWQDGRIKMLVTALLLRFRREHPLLFSRGDYHACAVESSSGFVGAYRRQHEGVELLVMFARWPLTRQRDPAWHGARVRVDHPGVWRNLLTGEEYEVGGTLAASLLADDLPLMVLTRK
jgi:(1->4)-alpha-D-glucan 1-alpha-D-glucosylmutase